MSVKGYLPALAGIFSASVLLLGALYAGLFAPALAVPPWLWAFLLGSAVESAYFAAYLLSPRTPWTVRLLELGFWLVPLYFLAGRSWRFLWLGGLTFLSWLLGRDYGAQLRDMERVADSLGDQAASTVSWEYEALESQGQSPAVEFFWRRLAGFGLLMAVLASAAHRRGLVEGSHLAWQLKLLGGIALCAGLTLQGGAYLFRLQMLWSCAKAEPDPALPRVWMRNLGLILLALLVLVYLAPVDYSPLTAETIGRLVMGLLQRGWEMPVPQERPAGERPQFPQEEATYGEPQGLDVAGLVFLIISFLLLAIFTAIILAVVGFILVELTKAEVERLRGLPKLAAAAYAALRKALAELSALLRRVKLQLPQARRTPGPLGRDQGAAPPGPGARMHLPERGIRALLRRIAREAGKKGLAFLPSQTPWEYGKLLQRRLGSQEDLIAEFFQGYQAVRYGARGLQGAAEQRVLAAGREILKKIEALEGEEQSDSGTRGG